MTVVERLRLFSLARSGELRPNKDAALADEARAEIERLHAHYADEQQRLFHYERIIAEQRAEIERLRIHNTKTLLEIERLTRERDLWEGRTKQAQKLLRATWPRSSG
jgi:hypothetical protein